MSRRGVRSKESIAAAAAAGGSSDAVSLRETRLDVAQGGGGHLLFDDDDTQTRSEDTARLPRRDQGAENTMSDQEQFELAVNERADVIAAARDLLLPGFKFGLMTIRQIQEAALKAAGVERSFEGKHDDYVRGWFDDAMSHRIRKMERADARHSSSTRPLSWTEAQARLDAFDRKVSAPAWQQPLATSTERRQDSTPRPPWQEPLRAGKHDDGEVFGAVGFDHDNTRRD